MMKLYDHPLSGNGHKVRLFVSILGLPLQSVFIDVPGGAQHTANFGAINPLRQIPVLIDGDVTIHDSQAILVYLARRYGEAWFPHEAVDMAKVVQWLSFAANEIGNSLQPARMAVQLGEKVDIELAFAQKRGRRGLGILNSHLTNRDWLECGRATIADLACFPYVGLSREGGLILNDYPHILTWIARIMNMPGYIPMPGLERSSNANNVSA